MKLSWLEMESIEQDATVNINVKVAQDSVSILLRIVLFYLLMIAILTNEVWSADMSHEGHADPSMAAMKTMDNLQQSSASQHAQTQELPAQGGSAPAGARDPHANSGGYERDPRRRLTLADEATFYSLLVDRLEVVNGNEETYQLFDLQAWYGFDYNRLVFKTEGTVNDKELQEASSELLWGHAVATFWNTQLGARYDSNDGPNRSWLAMGIQGLAPYWFELDTTFYVGESLRTSLSVDAEYELLITQKLILQTRFEGTVFGKSDDENFIGSGLTDLALGFRLRYEFWREMAPYVGIEWSKKFGDTASLVKAVNGETSESLLIAGVRFWF